MFNITVSLSSGDSYDLEINENTTGRCLKELLTEIHGIDGSKLIFFFEGEPIPNDVPLVQHNVLPDCVVEAELSAEEAAWRRLLRHFGSEELITTSAFSEEVSKKDPDLDLIRDFSLVQPAGVPYVAAYSTAMYQGASQIALVLLDNMRGLLGKVTIMDWVHFCPTVKVDVVKYLLHHNVPFGSSHQIRVKLCDSDIDVVRLLFNHGWKLPIGKYLPSPSPKILEALKSIGGVDFTELPVNYTPGMIAVARRGSKETMNAIFIDKYKDYVGVTDRDGMTALMHASCLGRLYACRKLLEMGSDINAADHDGHTALIHAMSNAHSAYETVKMLLEMRPSANLSCPNKSTCLTVACSKKPFNSQLISLFLQSPSSEFLDAKDEYGYTAAMICLRAGNVTDYKKVIKLGGSPPSDSFLWETLRLQCVTSHRYLKPHVVEFLRTEYPDILNMSDPTTGKTPLLLARKNGNLAVEKILQDREATVQTTAAFRN